MAKKTTTSATTPTNTKVFSFDDLNNFLTKDVKSGGDIISKMNFEQEFISSGIHVLDALTSARILGGGIAANRFTVLAGPSSVGKSFLALNYCKSAQLAGYSILYIDTEGTVDKTLVENFGLDLSKFRLENKLATVEMFKIYMAKFLKRLEEAKAAGQEIPKMLIVIDSIGNFPSEKEITDAESGDNKADVGNRNKAMKSVFRIITAKLNNLNIGLIGVGHTYETMEMFSKTVLSGGTGIYYNASTIIFLSKAKLDEGDKDELDLQSGIIVTAKTEKNRLAKPKKVKFEISFTGGANKFKGLEYWCTPENFGAIGIAKGKKTIDETTGEVSVNPGGNNWYIAHLDKHIPGKMLHTKEVFTPEVLKKLDEVCYDYFRYKSVTELQQFEKQMKELEEKLEAGENIGFGIDADDITGDKLFN